MNFAIFGAAGTMGKETVKTLLSQGHSVTAFVRNPTQERHLSVYLEDRGPFQGSLVMYILDVDEHGSVMEAMFDDLFDRSMLDAVIYLVGHCPATGMKEVVSTPLTNMTSAELGDDFSRHVFGLHRVVQTIHPYLQDGARVVVVNSAINYMWGLIPAKMFAGNYAAAKAAQAVLTRALRFDPVIQQKNLKMQLLEVGAADTDFHRNAPKELRAPVSVPLPKVIEQIIKAANSQKVVDKQVVPFGQRVAEVIAAIWRLAKW